MVFLSAPTVNGTTLADLISHIVLISSFNFWYFANFVFFYFSNSNVHRHRNYFFPSSSQQQCLAFWSQSPYNIVLLHSTTSLLLYFFSEVCINHSFSDHNSHIIFKALYLQYYHIFIYTPFASITHIHTYFWWWWMCLFSSCVCSDRLYLSCTQQSLSPAIKLVFFLALSMFNFCPLFQKFLLKTVYTFFFPSAFLSLSFKFVLVYSIVIFKSFSSSCTFNQWLKIILSILSEAIFFHPNTPFTTYQILLLHLSTHINPTLISFHM